MAFRSGFVAIVGRPNVGKSTLLNQLVGQKIAITSPVSQTTRHRIKGVVTSEKGQIVFLDTPGFSKQLGENDQLSGFLTTEGHAAIQDADAVIAVMDASQMPGKGDIWVIEQAKKTGLFILLILNKVDKIKAQTPQARQARKKEYTDLMADYPHKWDSIMISAKTGKQLSSVCETILRQLPAGVAYYPEDAATDQRFRELAAELIREQVLHHTQDEIPHSVAIGIEKFDESKPGRVTIEAVLFVDQESQKGILIGKDGSMIKTIGTKARLSIQEMMECPVTLNLNVKLKKNWRKDPSFLKSLGLALPN